ncbi:unnamed protein product [Clonostachys rhizophaga]|uniref:Rhodopsin domain-containing protein n=1 Tax=Clonostachys rhizophaga TaxID=160324 RepID=A0A9N9VEN1_9HYPO|nr:unnamed protein product [Clonostachys rhizophaga]
MALPGQLPPLNYDDRGPGLVTCVVVGLVVSTIGISTRFWARAVLFRMQIWWDDWSILLTTIVSHAFLALEIYWTTVRMGRHSWMIPMELLWISLILNRVILMIYATAVRLLKVSALLFYVRVFKISRTFRYVLWGVGTFVSVWWFVLCLTPWTFCRPWSKTVNPDEPGVCIHPTEWYLTSSFLNAFTDLVVLLLTMPLVWKLQMNTQKKLSVAGVFILGFASAFLSFARFIIIAQQPNMLNESTDPSWQMVPMTYLSMLEAPVGILALSAPSIRQLVGRAAKHHSLASLFSSNYGDKGSAGVSNYSAGKQSLKDPSYYELGSTKRSRWYPGASSNGESQSTTAIATRGSDDDEQRMMPEIPSRAINVSRDVEVAHHEASHH